MVGNRIIILIEIVGQNIAFFFEPCRPFFGLEAKNQPYPQTALWLKASTAS